MLPGLCPVEALGCRSELPHIFNGHACSRKQARNRRSFLLVLREGPQNDLDLRQLRHDVDGNSRIAERGHDCCPQFGIDDLDTAGPPYQPVLIAERQTNERAHGQIGAWRLRRLSQVGTDKAVGLRDPHGAPWPEGVSARWRIDPHRHADDAALPGVRTPPRQPIESPEQDRDRA
jgi:hypothetical protein